MVNRNITRNKSKKRRRKWFNDLTSEQKLNYLDKQAHKRSLKAMAKSDMIMDKMKLSFGCLKCIHKLTKNCKVKKDGCIYFADELNEVFGPAYE